MEMLSKRPSAEAYRQKASRSSIAPIRKVSDTLAPTRKVSETLAPTRKVSGTLAPTRKVSDFSAPIRKVSDTYSLPSYKDYPDTSTDNGSPVNTPARRPSRSSSRHSCRPATPSKAVPESSSTAILSALRNLQEKIRMLELEKNRAEFSLSALLMDGHLQSDSSPDEDIKRKASEPSNHDQVLVTQLAAAENRCEKLEGQLEQMKRMLPRTESISFPNQEALTERRGTISQQPDGLSEDSQLEKLEILEQEYLRLTRTQEHVAMKIDALEKKIKEEEHQRMLIQDKGNLALTERRGTISQQPDGLSEHGQLEKLEILEQEYLRLTQTQEHTEMKIDALERKIREEEHQRMLIQDKANLLETSMEANRMLLHSVSPRLSLRKYKEKKPNLKQLSLKHAEPHYRLRMRDIPFVTGTSVGGSHSVRANVQEVLSLLKQHQPCLCNKRVLSRNADLSKTRNQSDTSSTSSSSSSSTCGDELSELLQDLQEELYLMCLEHSELMKQMEESVSERGALQREQDRLLVRMESKEEQINKLCKHKSQIKKIRKKPKSENSRAQQRLAPTRRRFSAPTKAQLAERSRCNRMLLRDMKALQKSLQN